MKWVSSPLFADTMKVLSVISQVTVVILAIFLIVNMTTRQYASSQVEMMRGELLEMMQQDRKETSERFRLLKDELVTYQSTREGRAKLFADRMEQYKQERELAVERLNRRIDNLNTKLNYWTGKVKKSEIEGKLKNQ